MQLTDWLVVILLVAILVVLLDGVRRKLGERRNRVVVKLEKNLPPAGDVDDEILLTSAELPNGGARTLPRNRPVPSLRNLKSTRKVAAAADSAAGIDARNLQAVPVLMDAVEVEEERIEHANVFAGTDVAAAFDQQDFGQSPDFALDADPPALSPGSAHSAAVDEDYEEDATMLTPHPGTPQARDTRYMGRDDEDDEDDDFEDEEEFEDEDEEEFDDDEEEFEDDELPLPGDDDFEDDFEDDDDEEDDYDDDEDDLDDDEDDDYDDDEEEEEEDLDELEGLPEDEWGSEEEQDMLADDYESEPVLLQDAYSKAASHFSRPARQPRIEPGFGDNASDANGFDEDAFDEDFSAALGDSPLEPVGGARQRAEEKPVLQRQDQVDLFREEPRVAREDSRSRPAPRHGERQQPQQAEPEPEPEPVWSGPQEVIIVNVMARQGQYFAGADLLQVLQQQGLRLGEMSIFHRHADHSGSGPILFSMANMVKPGTFDLATMDEFVTPGVSLFMQMPNKLGNMHCFEQLLKTAGALAQALDGELKDENRSVFTRQTVEHCRQRVRDFELLLLSKKQ